MAPWFWSRPALRTGGQGSLGPGRFPNIWDPLVEAASAQNSCTGTSGPVPFGDGQMDLLSLGSRHLCEHWGDGL